MAEQKRNLLLFFDRPAEPCFVPKGDDNTVFQVPESYYPEKYKAVANALEDRFGGSKAGRTVNVRNIALPDLSLPLQLPVNEQFSLFMPRHRRMAAKLIDIFLGMRDLEDLVSICSFCQLQINPYLFNYCLSVAILHRPDTKGMNIPTFVETFPDKFMDPKAIRSSREVTRVEQVGERKPITIPSNFTAGPKEPEQRCAYFREDIGLNLHHWHWHLVYPFESANLAIVDKDRRGELLYYMHQQIIARYNAERLCNGLARVVPLQDFRSPIAEGYFPKLNSQTASRAWPPRFEDTPMQDLNRPVDLIKIDISELEIWRDRFLQAIDSMSILLPNGKRMPLTEETGIDVLGNLLEASMLSPNRAYYGDLHNMLHVIIGYCHDPDNRHLEQSSVMGEPATTMRDPAFYRVHSFVDDCFHLFKEKLPPYAAQTLDFPGVRVSAVRVSGDALRTRWEQSTLELGRGLDFTPRGSVLARFVHLQHEDFTYKIDVNNTTGKSLMGTVRIFLAPTLDEKGKPLPFNQQRKLMIELDKFSQALKPGSSTISRASTESSVTIPYERTFMNQDSRPGQPGSVEAEEFDFCGCGWPHHLLIPKGNEQGFPCVLFAMITNWNEDRVEQDLVGTCNDAASYCGIRDRKYPDKRPMGFPFDRPAPSAVTISDFLTPNMAVNNMTIKFSDVTKIRGQK